MCWRMFSIEYIECAPKCLEQEEKDDSVNSGNHSGYRQSFREGVYYHFRGSVRDLMIVDGFTVNDIIRERASIFLVSQRIMPEDNGQIAPDTSPIVSGLAASQPVVELDRQRECLLEEN